MPMSGDDFRRLATADDDRACSHSASDLVKTSQWGERPPAKDPKRAPKWHQNGCDGPDQIDRGKKTLNSRDLGFF